MPQAVSFLLWGLRSVNNVGRKDSLIEYVLVSHPLFVSPPGLIRASSIWALVMVSYSRASDEGCHGVSLLRPQKAFWREEPIPPRMLRMLEHNVLWRGSGGHLGMADAIFGNPNGDGQVRAAWLAISFGMWVEGGG